MFNRIVAMGGRSVSKALTGVVKKFTINEGHINKNLMAVI